jgi:uncharacterized protein
MHWRQQFHIHPVGGMSEETKELDYENPYVIRRLLVEAKTIAIVGMSSNPQKASHFVGTYLKYAGYRIVPVNPVASGEILGEKVYPDLTSIPFEVDMVDVFRRPDACPGIALEAVDIGASSLWLQLGIVSDEAGEIARSVGLDVVMNRCIKMEHGRYNGAMHWVGMNTGVISARRAKR